MCGHVHSGRQLRSEQRAAEAQTHTGTLARALAGAQRHTRDSHLDLHDLRDLPVHFLRRHVREGWQQLPPEHSPAPSAVDAAAPLHLVARPAGGAVESKLPEMQQPLKMCEPTKQQMAADKNAMPPPSGEVAVCQCATGVSGGCSTLARLLKELGRHPSFLAC